MRLTCGLVDRRVPWVRVVSVVSLCVLTGSCGGDPPTGPTPPSPTIVIESPASGTVGLGVTFRWRLTNPEAGRTYTYEVRLDKGVNACDAVIRTALTSWLRWSWIVWSIFPAACVRT